MPHCGEAAWGNICSPDLLCFISLESQPRHVNRAVPIASSRVLWYRGRANKQTGEFYATACETFSQCCGGQVLPSPLSCNSSTYTWKPADMKANVHVFCACIACAHCSTSQKLMIEVSCHPSLNACGCSKVPPFGFQRLFLTVNI